MGGGPHRGSAARVGHPSDDAEVGGWLTPPRPRPERPRGNGGGRPTAVGRRRGARSWAASPPTRLARGSAGGSWSPFQAAPPFCGDLIGSLTQRRLGESGAKAHAGEENDGAQRRRTHGRTRGERGPQRVKQAHQLLDALVVGGRGRPSDADRWSGARCQHRGGAPRYWASCITTAACTTPADGSQDAAAFALPPRPHLTFLEPSQYRHRHMDWKKNHSPPAGARGQHHFSQINSVPAATTLMAPATMQNTPVARAPNQVKNQTTHAESPTSHHRVSQRGSPVSLRSIRQSAGPSRAQTRERGTHGRRWRLPGASRRSDAAMAATIRPTHSGRRR